MVEQRRRKLLTLVPELLKGNEKAELNNELNSCSDYRCVEVQPNVEYRGGSKVLLDDDWWPARELLAGRERDLSGRNDRLTEQTLGRNGRICNREDRARWVIINYSRRRLDRVRPARSDAHLALP